jgi:hypothetical protein
MIPGHKGYVKTSIFFTTYDSSVANEIYGNIASKYKVLNYVRSRVVKELYFIEVEGNVKEFVEELLKGRVIWYKVDVLEFK